MADLPYVPLVRPPDWRNPSPTARYDLVVLGAGTAGLVTAAGAAGLGASVALVERDRMGGDCLNVGCVPSKALLASARMAASARRAGDYGVSTADVAAGFAAVMDRMRRLRAGLAPHDSAERFRSLGVDVYFGDASFVAPDAVSVADSTLRFKRAAICTGARAAVPDLPGLVHSHYLTNETVFDLVSLPQRLAILGGGPIGCELAQAFVRFGSQVTLIERGDCVLPRDDLDAANLVHRSLERDGVTILLGQEATRVERSGHETRITLSQPSHLAPCSSSPDSPKIPADALLLALGRQPNVESLNLPAAGIAFDARRGVTVDEHLRTTNHRVFAAGDVCSAFKFTHAADALARTVIQNALFLGRKKASGLTIPWCTYTSPELAHVGLTPAEADRLGIPIDTFTQDFAGVDRAVLDGTPDGFARIHVRKGTDRVVGGTIVGDSAGDLIALLSYAMTRRLGLRTFASAVFPYPTRAEALRKLADAYNRTRLTPAAKRVVRTWLRWS